MSQLRGFLARPGRGAPAPAWKRRWLWRTGPCIETPVGRGALAPCIETPETFLRIDPSPASEYPAGCRKDRFGQSSSPPFSAFLRLSPSFSVLPIRRTDWPQENGVRTTVPDAAGHKKRVSYLHRTATTTYPCLIPHLGESVGAGRIRLTPAQKYEFFVSLQRKKELSAILSLFFESRMPKRLPGCVSEGGAGRVNE